MSTLYKKRNIWYLSVTVNGNRTSRSLCTKYKKVAKKLKPKLELELLSELTGLSSKPQNIPFNQLVDKYMSADHMWSNRTIDIKKNSFKQYLGGNPLPSNPTTRAILVRDINACWNWGLKHGLVKVAHKLEGGNRWESRHRVINNDELEILFKEVSDDRFNKFVRFAYYTGARSGEIRRISNENVFNEYILAYGKTGKRIIKLNTQAQEIINSLDSLWNYSKNYVSHKFKKEVRKLEIRNARFHDLRRTFGYNLIRQGRPIYEVSKLLGHSSVTTTERHYAPLLTTEIEDFVL